jgi:hypothetical protein
MPLRSALSIVLGAAFGFGYYRVVGCRSGACPLSSNPYVSTVYGALMGYLVSTGPH